MGRTTEGSAIKKKRLSKRKSTKRKLTRCTNRVKYVVPIICPGLTVDISESNIPSTSILDLSIKPKGIGIGNIDIDGIMQLKTYDMPALFTCCETGVFSHSAKCMILDFLLPEVADFYFTTYEKGYGVISESESEESDVDID